MAHRTLAIKTLISIEADDVGYARATFNAPLKCITVEHGYTTDVLPTLNLDRHKSIVWLDHDTGAEDSAFRDISLLVENCKGGSVVLVTVNAEAKRVQKLIDASAPDKVTPDQIREYLATKMGDVVPTTLVEEDVDDDGYPKLIRRILETALKSALRLSGRRLEFLKLYDFTYRDGPAMATVGGLLADAKTVAKVTADGSIANWPGIIAETIRTPPLTMREKMAFDQLLPSSAKLVESTFEARAGFPLTQEQISAYVDYYSLYPTFAELQL